MTALRRIRIDAALSRAVKGRDKAIRDWNLAAYDRAVAQIDALLDLRNTL